MTPRRAESAVSSTSSSSGEDPASSDDISTIILVRHGDRFDYANPSWVDNARSAGALPTDPPLSALGHRQASDTAKFLGASSAVKDINGNSPPIVILASPYLRVIQTACPTSDALGVPICIEEGLSEAHATPGEGVLPTARDRFAYFPQVDVSHRRLLKVSPTPGYQCSMTGNPCEAFAGHYAVRMGHMARKLEEAFRGRTVLCFSHAASVALVAALLRRSMRGLKFAPCGVYELRRKGDGPWEMVRDGSSNEPYVSENSPTTYPWGFGEKHFQEHPKEEGSENAKHYHGSSEGIGLDYFAPKEN